MSTTWPTTKHESVDCFGCGKKGTCTISPDHQRSKCWPNGGKLYDANGECSPGCGTKSNGTGYVGKTHRKPKFGDKKFPTAAAAFKCISPPGFTLTAEYSYLGRDGAEVFRVGRYDADNGRDKKQCRPIYPNCTGWLIGDPDLDKLPLYRLDKLNTAGRVYVVEGEKAADCAAALGLNVTTSAHGSSSASKSDWLPLKGCPEVIILPDNDEPGEKYTRAVVDLVKQIDASIVVKIVRLPGLPAEGDIVEYADSYGDAAAPEDIAASVHQLADEAPEIRPPRPGPVLIRLSDVQPRQVDWLWRDRIALGRLTLLCGRPGEGKSYLGSDMSARVTNGTPWPDGTECPLGSVLMISAEDDPGDTIRPRLDAHGANVERVHLLSAVRRVTDGEPLEVTFTLQDVGAMEAALKQIPDCKLVIIDPIGSFIGGTVDAHRDNEVRAVLSPVAKLAEKYGAAVLIVAHRRKGSSVHADDSAMGSRAFTGIVRAAWHLSRDRDDADRRLLLPGKNNLAKEGSGLAFRIDGTPARLEWEAEPVTMTADDAMESEVAGTDREDRQSAVAQAELWLRTELCDLQEHPVSDVKEAAKAAGIATRAIERASSRLGVIVHRATFGGGYVWRLPKQGNTAVNPP